LLAAFAACSTRIAIKDLGSSIFRGIFMKTVSQHDHVHASQGRLPICQLVLPQTPAAERNPSLLKSTSLGLASFSLGPTVKGITRKLLAGESAAEVSAVLAGKTTLEGHTGS
jgi:hypothetical protein